MKNVILYLAILGTIVSWGVANKYKRTANEAVSIAKQALDAAESYQSLVEFYTVELNKCRQSK
jgi:hypothetical protein